MLRIALDVSVGREMGTGRATYVHALVRSLAGVDQENAYCLFGNPGMRLACARPNFRYVPYQDIGFVHVWHCLDLSSPYVAHCARRRAGGAGHGAALLVTVHDLLFETDESDYPPPVRRRFRANLEAARAAGARFVAPSRWSAGEIARRLGLSPREVAVIPLAAGPEFRPGRAREALAAVRARYGLSRPFVLFVGAPLWRKNLAGALAAFRLLKSRRRGEGLAVVGTSRAEAARLLQSRGRDALLGVPDVAYLGFVPARDLPLLYNAALMLVYPSRAEGFGLPVLEAMASGLPVVAARAGAIAEVAGDAALLVDPEDPEELAAAIAMVVDDQMLRQRLAAAGARRAREFSWERTARATAGLYLQVAA